MSLNITCLLSDKIVHHQYLTTIIALTLKASKVFIESARTKFGVALPKTCATKAIKSVQYGTHFDLSNM